MLSNSGINKIILLGKVCTEPQFNTGYERFLSFNLMTNEAIKKGTESIQHNEFHSVKVPDKVMTTEGIDLQTGQIVYIEGKIHTKAYTDEVGVKRYDVSIVAGKVELVSQLPVVF
jgi:single-strand DNA-binding protein